MLLDITGPAVLSKYTQSAAIRSILYDPKYTLEHLKEINFVSNYFSGNESNKSNPLVFITVQKIMAHTPVGFDHELAFCMLAMLLDLAIACQLYRLAKEYYATKTDHMKWEIATEKNMNPLIYPISQNRMHLFGSHFDDIDKDLSPLFATSNIPSLSATIYYLNPITVLTSSGGNVQGIWILLLVSSLLEAVKGNATLSGIYLAVLCHVDIFNIVFLIPSALLWKNYYEFESKELKGRRPSSICKYRYKYFPIAEARVCLRLHKMSLFFNTTNTNSFLFPISLNHLVLRSIFCFFSLFVSSCKYSGPHSPRFQLCGSETAVQYHPQFRRSYAESWYGLVFVYQYIHEIPGIFYDIMLRVDLYFLRTAASQIFQLSF